MTGAAVASRQRREQEEEEGRKRAKKLREESEGSEEGESSAPSSPSSSASASSALSLLRGRPPLSPSSPTYWGCPVCRKPHALLPTSETGEKGGAAVERWGVERKGFFFGFFFFFLARAKALSLSQLTLFFSFLTQNSTPQSRRQGQQQRHRWLLRGPGSRPPPRAPRADTGVGEEKRATGGGHRRRCFVSFVSVPPPAARSREAPAPFAPVDGLP